MLSYMVPALEEKPPPVPNKDRLQLDLAPDKLTNGQLTNGHATTASRKATVSTESSASSLSSGDVPAATHTIDKPKPKLLNGATKHTTLKRVSFGSSKGSMVETLIYESPLQEEPEGSPTPTPDAVDPETTGAKAPSKVRVTFFESEKPLVVSSPEQSDDLDAPTTMTSASPLPDHAPPYNRQASTDSGWDNPFRPDGDLSREADEIVELIKGGKPITPTPGTVAKVPAVEENGIAPPQTNAVLTQSPSPAKGANGSALVSNEKPPPSSPAAVELQRGTVVPPSDASQVEHIVLKKKPKCKCCVIQ
ncbi:uncharacterized protein LOC142328638 [Lycorma delicatula]|uniref:uncharacterized protein LOC142328638 n=1 Tax=Lycorma delicatula TaxID=130591 RepID=UPI003F514289